MSSHRLSVVIASYNRRALLERLLDQLAQQTLPASDFEAIVVDDGSAEPVREALAGRKYPYALRLEAQANQGAAAARHRGVQQARGELLVIVDDDMQVGPDFLEQHARAHPAGSRRVAIGRIAADPEVSGKPLFERWHQRVLDDLADDASRGQLPLRGNNLYTGNVSLRRADYLAVGGFDAALGHSEDVELGLRLERAGVEFVMAEQAQTLHGSDHTDVAKWRKRARLYGVYDHRIAQKHPDLSHANPWRFLSELHPAARPFLLGAVLAPGVSTLLSRAAYRAATWADRLGAERAALAGTTLSYGLEYFRGLREEIGSALGAALELGGYAILRAGASGPEVLRQLTAEIAADHATMTRYQSKYDERALAPAGIGNDLVNKIGFQIMAAYRLMRAFHRSVQALAAKATSRAIRHLYGADIHWEAELAPGVMVVHGMGMAISRAARVGPECILFQNVTLGIGTDPVSRRSGAPVVEANVHLGPGATLVGPITVGAGSKIMAGVVLSQSVPAGSLVEAPAAQVGPRITRAPLVRPRRSEEPTPSTVEGQPSHDA
jgi:serine acetyltransferase/GT2 family glycosyltransferase